MLTLNGHEVDIERAIDISVPVAFNDTSPTAFGVDQAQCRHLYSIRDDGKCGCICDEITFCAHTHTTHIESVAHIDPKLKSTLNYLSVLPPLMGAILVDAPSKNGQITKDCLTSLVSTSICSMFEIDAVILRTDSVRSSEGPYVPRFTFISPEIIAEISNLLPHLGVLLIDSVSIDPEHDEGRLAAHRAFFNSSHPRFIIELCNIPHFAPSGLYALSINAAAFNSDAIPCRPILYPIK